ncbi:unnamed protein product [Amoebophrya sp. A25]|nr:unnamed protein product [Amoebophrya sp. A25]|eukprot:GSA25T00006144001.1
MSSSTGTDQQSEFSYFTAGTGSAVDAATASLTSSIEEKQFFTPGADTTSSYGSFVDAAKEPFMFFPEPFEEVNPDFDPFNWNTWKYATFGDFVRRTFAFEVLVDFIALAVIAHALYAPCDGDWKYMCWLLVGILGSIPTTMVLDYWRKIGQSFRLIFVKESIATSLSILWFCTGLVWTAHYPASSCGNCLWTTVAVISLLHLVMFALIALSVLLAALVPALIKLLFQVWSATSRPFTTANKQVAKQSTESNEPEYGFATRPSQNAAEP